MQRNHQGLIGGPARWKETWRLARLGTGEDELKKLPPSVSARHDEWLK